VNILILGGTRFVGRHLTETALAAGHQVTLFNRGRTNPDLFPEAEHIHGDRYRDLSRLDGRRWDAVIDVSGYLPRDVRASAERLAGAVDRYVYVSTISVYADWKSPGMNEDAPLEEPEPGDETLDEVPSRGYGRLKALCERFVQEAVPDRSLIVRPCIIVGPWDPTGRFAYWVERTARGGEVLAPGRPDRPVELIDARDLATWVVSMTERRETGVYNATGPRDVLTMEGMLHACRDTLGSDARFTWIPDDFLDARDVRLPFWLPEEKFGFNLVDHSRAVAKGLTYRPLADTILDVHAWVSEDPQGRDNYDFPPERETDLLSLWNH
jgi:2'-hydroxyisoflavone reductase